MVYGVSSFPGLGRLPFFLDSISSDASAESFPLLLATLLNKPDLTIADLGEQGLLQLLKSYCPADVVGDDAALLTPKPGHQLVVTTDVLVDGVHFSDRTTPPHSAGWRAVAANLSDLAAMGAKGLGITVGLSLPSRCSVNWVEQLYQGMADCLAPYGIPIVGGDVCRAEQRAIAITALGQVETQRAWRRDTAQVGDAIVVTGSHGGSRAGLALLLGEPLEWFQGAEQLTRSLQDELIRQHQYPRPRLDWVEGFRALETVKGLGDLRVTAMDSSDGLADAICQLCCASGVGARVSADAIPTPQAIKSWSNETLNEKVLNDVLYGGEDFELVLCLEPRLAHQVCIEPSLGAVIIGEITADADVLLWQEDGEQPRLNLDSGFQHFS